MKTKRFQILGKAIFIFIVCLSVTATILSFSIERNSEVTEIFKEGKLEKRIIAGNCVYQGFLVSLSITAKHIQDDIVKWKHDVKRLPNNTYEVIFTPDIKSPWHI